MDMVGRVDEAHLDDDRYIYLIGSDKLSTELHDISEAVNSEHIGIALDYTFNAPDDPNRFYYRSDHYNFADDIPVIFYFSGVRITTVWATRRTRFCIRKWRRSDSWCS